MLPKQRMVSLGGRGPTFRGGRIGWNAVGFEGVDYHVNGGEAVTTDARPGVIGNDPAGSRMGVWCYTNGDTR